MSKNKHKAGPMMESFIYALERKHISYQFTDDNAKADGIVIMFGRRSCQPLSMYCFINEEIQRFVFFVTPMLYGESTVEMLKLVNQANQDIPFMSFIFDEDQNVVFGRASGIITPETAAPICMETMDNILIACNDFDKMVAGLNFSKTINNGKVHGVPGIPS